MENTTYKIDIKSDDLDSINRGITNLINALRESPNVLEIKREKNDEKTMDLGHELIKGIPTGIEM